MTGLPPSSTQALIDLDAIPHDDWDKLLEECLRVTSSVLGIAFASYWRFRDHPPSIICELGYQALSHRLERGFTLAEHECPNYLEHVRRTHVLAIEDAVQDQRTCDLRSYLIARGIGALLDTAVRVGGGSESSATSTTEARVPGVPRSSSSPSRPGKPWEPAWSRAREPGRNSGSVAARFWSTPWPT